MNRMQAHEFSNLGATASSKAFRRHFITSRAPDHEIGAINRTTAKPRTAKAFRSLVLRLCSRDFFDVAFAAGLALEGVEIWELAKPQCLAHKPHRLRAPYTTRPRRKHLVRLPAKTLAQHEQSSGSSIGLPPEARPRSGI